ncbi:hypothetical protein PIB30_026396 [Stylosanthes scabra]|uniref:Uncharacterized protein n=1 Tax=Stylosanthes scabra TaxID=79078 RepID=A0ABU6RAN6_9FABA|nr:hypothetical protein [Stylosanthes scabra]
MAPAGLGAAAAVVKRDKGNRHRRQERQGKQSEGVRRENGRAMGGCDAKRERSAPPCCHRRALPSSTASSPLSSRRCYRASLVRVDRVVPAGHLLAVALRVVVAELHHHRHHRCLCHPVAATVTSLHRTRGFGRALVGGRPPPQVLLLLVVLVLVSFLYYACSGGGGGDEVMVFLVVVLVVVAVSRPHDKARGITFFSRSIACEP